ncbi:YxeA family protein [Paenibacillus lentus]|uniref:YxeA family protein n=1 Tax=Paenibacillus lentus TaxID=1338368 RepID=A0A3Q8S5D3_9BACL|nr:YxeA family protein [Paenibacillus lentus]AZK47300.1 YxeA family protein [Paenibacillus lentus]
MKRILIVVGLFIIMISAFIFFFYSPAKLTPENPSGKTIYYTMVQNNNVKTENNRYSYNLDSYNKKGSKKNLSFSASKELREGAYLELYTTTFRGVTYWQEIQFEDLPVAVKEIYDNNAK